MTALRRTLSSRAKRGFCFSLLALAASTAAAQGRLVPDTLHSKALEKNRYGDSPDRGLLVYLPASYDSSPTKRYPVVYLLHGFGGTERTWTSLGPIKPAMDTLVRNGAVREMVIVMPNGRNVFDGSFYTNSASAGNWDDFVSKELVAYIDGKYRTLARPESRGLAGHSMGGYGAFTLGMRHGGDVYGAVYSMSGCCTRFAREPGTGGVWDTLSNVRSLADVRRLGFIPRVMLAMAAAFSPDTTLAPLYTTLSFVRRGDKLEGNSRAFQQWQANEPLSMIPTYADKLKRLRGLMFDGGLSDNLVSPASLAAMDAAFTRAGVRHTYETYEGDHTNRVAARLATSVLPFFSRTLDFGDVRR
jgi:S-formylglutathione hydrolase FrmB